MNALLGMLDREGAIRLSRGGVRTLTWICCAHLANDVAAQSRRMILFVAPLVACTNPGGATHELPSDTSLWPGMRR